MPVQPVPAAQVPQMYVPTLKDGVTQATPDAWPLGNVQTQKLAAFMPWKHNHIGIVGTSGTGKTTGVGYLVVSHALRHDVHVVIVDGDSGASWAPFAPWVEHIPADERNIGDVLAEVDKEITRRGEILAQRGALTWEQTNGVIRPMMVIVEEFGDLRSRLGAVSKTSGEALDTRMEGLVGADARPAS